MPGKKGSSKSKSGTIPMASKKRINLDESDSEIPPVHPKKIKVEQNVDAATTGKMAEYVIDKMADMAEAKMQRMVDQFETSLKKKFDVLMGEIGAIDKSIDGVRLSVAGEGLLAQEKNTDTITRLT